MPAAFLSPQEPCEKTPHWPILQVRKPRLRQVPELAKGLTVCKWPHQSSDMGLLTPEPTRPCFTSFPSFLVKGRKEGKPSAFRPATSSIFITTICTEEQTEGLRRDTTLIPVRAAFSLLQVFSAHLYVLPLVGLIRQRNRWEAANMPLCLSFLLCKMGIVTVSNPAP